MRPGDTFAYMDDRWKGEPIETVWAEFLDAWNAKNWPAAQQWLGRLQWRLNEARAANPPDTPL